MTTYRVTHYTEKIIRNVHSAKKKSFVLSGFRFVVKVAFSADAWRYIKSGIGQTAPSFSCLAAHPKPLAHTSNIRREEKGGAGSRMFSSEYVS